MAAVATLLGATTITAGAGCSAGEVTIGEQEASTTGPDGASGDDTAVEARSPDARDGCVDTIYCPTTSHWDPQLCTCVPFDASVTGDGACVGAQGDHCGGNIANACMCAAGLRCVIEAGVPPDVGGSCEP
jgi:hypothetical protein